MRGLWVGGGERRKLCGGGCLAGARHVRGRRRVLLRRRLHFDDARVALFVRHRPESRAGHETRITYLAAGAPLSCRRAAGRCTDGACAGASHLHGGLASGGAPTNQESHRLDREAELLGKLLWVSVRRLLSCLLQAFLHQRLQPERQRLVQPLVELQCLLKCLAYTGCTYIIYVLSNECNREEKNMRNLQVLLALEVREECVETGARRLAQLAAVRGWRNRRGVGRGRARGNSGSSCPHLRLALLVPSADQMRRVRLVAGAADFTQVAVVARRVAHCQVRVALVAPLRALLGFDRRPLLTLLLVDVLRRVAHRYGRAGARGRRIVLTHVGSCLQHHLLVGCTV